MTEQRRIPWEALQQAVHAVFAASGSPEAEAAILANHLVRANLTGHDSHGVTRVHPYLERLGEGILFAGQQPTVFNEHAGTLMVDGKRGYGQVGAHFAMDVALERARERAVAAVGLTNVNHIGRLAEYAVKAAEQGCIGLVFTCGGGANRLVAPFGGRVGRMGTAPISAAFPSDQASPVVLDMATSALANGKFRLWAQHDQLTPPQVLQDAQGQPTRDARVLGEGGSILPLGGAQGYKGYLLNVLVEVLGGILTAGGFSGKVENAVHNNASLFIAIRVDAFREPAAFRRDIGALIAHLKATPPLPGQAVLYPGELEARYEAERRATGLPLPPGTVDNLRAAFTRYGVDATVLDDAAPASA